MNTGFSDHSAQILTIQNVNKEIKRSNVSYKFIRSSSNANIEYLNYLLQQQSWEQIYSHTSVKNAYTDFINTFKFCYETAMPKVRVKIKEKKPNWITSGINKSSERLRFLDAIRKSGNVSDSFKNYFHKYKKL